MLNLITDSLPTKGWVAQPKWNVSDVVMQVRNRPQGEMQSWITPAPAPQLPLPVSCMMYQPTNAYNRQGAVLGR